MMQLGQAAGNAAYIAKSAMCDFTDVRPGELRDLLRNQHVQLEWPLPAELRSWMKDAISGLE